ncbi:MAG: transporter substrate-binding domain-containing protein, partial [Sulfuricurvum sp.]|uniref:transporter substrate-binding domain-containing protein n=1 Tax=Sulfuricurvum sp. TaxID=2025608 RepID=UPI002732630D
MKTLLSVLLVTVLLGNANNLEPKISLNAAEQEYLRTKKEITMCVDPDWEPFEVIDKNGDHVGIAADLIQLAAKRAGLNIKLIRTTTWEETLKLSKSK